MQHASIPVLKSPYQPGLVTTSPCKRFCFNGGVCLNLAVLLSLASQSKQVSVNKEFCKCQPMFKWPNCEIRKSVNKRSTGQDFSSQKSPKISSFKTGFKSKFPSEFNHDILENKIPENMIPENEILGEKTREKMFHHAPKPRKPSSKNFKLKNSTSKPTHKQSGVTMKQLILVNIGILAVMSIVILGLMYGKLPRPRQVFWRPRSTRQRKDSDEEQVIISASSNALGSARMGSEGAGSRRNWPQIDFQGIRDYVTTKT